MTLEELNFLRRCKEKGDWLAVGVHSDWWMNWSQGGFVQNYEARREIIKSLRFVDEIFTFNDTDGTINQFLKLLKICYPNEDITYMSSNHMLNEPEIKLRGITFETLK